jgi:MtN3 and saliva related transmembrane protein
MRSRCDLKISIGRRAKSEFQGTFYNRSPVGVVCSKTAILGVLLLSVITLSSCEDLVIRDTSSLFAPSFQRSEVLGIVAGFGTTFAAVPDLLAMLKRRSSAGINPRMAGIMGVF